MSKAKLIEELKDVINIQQLEAKTDFVVSWYAKKYNKIIWRVGNLNKEGCRVWESDGKKYMCFWDTVLERYIGLALMALGLITFFVSCIMEQYYDRKLHKLNERLRKDDKWRSGN
jgi:hypothetical protein